MSEQKISKSLADLRQEIERLDTGDQEAKERLVALVEDVEQRLSSDTMPDQAPDLVQHMGDLIAELEVKHPRATGIINDLMMALSNSGI